MKICFTILLISSFYAYAMHSGSSSPVRDCSLTGEERRLLAQIVQPTPRRNSETFQNQQNMATNLEHADPVSLARYVLNYDHRAERRAASSFLSELSKYTKKYSSGPVWAAARVRMGDIYRESKSLQTAKECYVDSLSHQEALPETKGWAGIQLGYMYIRICKYKRAQIYFEGAESIIDPWHLPKLYNGLGVVWYCLSEGNKAYHYWNKVIDSCEAKEQELTTAEAINKPESNKTLKALQREKAHAFHNCAILYADKGDYGSAIECLSKSKDLGRPYSDEEFKLHVSTWQSALNSQLSQ